MPWWAVRCWYKTLVACNFHFHTPVCAFCIFGGGLDQYKSKRTQNDDHGHSILIVVNRLQSVLGIWSLHFVVLPSLMEMVRMMSQTLYSLHLHWYNYNLGKKREKWYWRHWRLFMATTALLLSIIDAVNRQITVDIVCMAIQMQVGAWGRRSFKYLKVSFTWIMTGLFFDVNTQADKQTPEQTIGADWHCTAHSDTTIIV